jgi:hypothetical protein
MKQNTQQNIHPKMFKNWNDLEIPQSVIKSILIVQNLNLRYVFGVKIFKLDEDMRKRYNLENTPNIRWLFLMPILKYSFLLVTAIERKTYPSFLLVKQKPT